MKTIIFIIAIFLPLILLSITAEIISAATATSSANATSSATATPSQTQDFQEKIKTIYQEQIKDKLGSAEASLREQIENKVLVGYSGNINSINSDHLSLGTKDETIIQITTNEKTVFVKSGANIKFTSLAISDKIIVIGTLLKDDIILAKRIVVIPENTEDVMTTTTVVAKVSSIDAKKKTLGLTIGNTEVVYTLTKEASRNAAIKLENINEGDTVFAITKKYEGKDYLSRAKII